MEKEKSSELLFGFVDAVLLIRLAGAAIALIIALVMNIPAFLRYILCLLSAAAAGYDIALKALSAAENKDFFAAPIIIVFVAVIAFFIGFPSEAAALVVLYQIGLLFIAYADMKSRETALYMAASANVKIAERMSVIIEDPKAVRMNTSATIIRSADIILKIAMALAVLYAILLPLFTTFGYRTSVHRALMVMLVSTPATMLISLPVTAIVGMCLSAGEGAVVSDAASLEQLSEADTVVFDNAGVFSEDEPKIISIQPKLIDRKTFIVFAAHAAYYSEQSFAKLFSQLYDQEYKLDVISDFVDIPGLGVDLTIGGAHVTLAKRSLFADRGVSVPVDESNGNQVYYMTVADKYVGKVVMSRSVKDGIEDLIEDFRDSGSQKLVLLTEEGREESERLAQELDLDGVYSQCDAAKKLKCVESMQNSVKGSVVYVYSHGIQTHSAADIDIRVGRQSKFADIILLPESVPELSYIFRISARMKEITTENMLFTFVVKALLIFLSLAGKCTLWFAIFIDLIAASASILNSMRVTKPSLFSDFSAE